MAGTLVMDAKITIVHGATIIDADGARPNGWMVAVDGVVRATGSGDGWRAHPEAGKAAVTDAAGAILAQGFLDLHTHGGGGAVAEEGAEAMLRARAAHRAHGTTRALVSFVSNPLDSLVRGLAHVRAAMEGDPSILGAHLEGPFLAPGRRGAHAAEYLLEPTAAAVAELIAAGEGVLRQVTIAPELPGALDAAERFVDAGVVVAIGHTECSAATARLAFDRGASLMTHLFNAMPPVHHREPGPALAALLDERVTVELIVDGTHLHPDMVAMAFALAPGRVALITDAMAAAGVGDGAYRLGDLGVTVSRGVATVTGTDTIAGSTLTQDVALRNSVAAGVPVDAAIAALTSTPERVLGLPEWRLRPGVRADLVLVDQATGVVRPL